MKAMTGRLQPVFALGALALGACSGSGTGNIRYQGVPVSQSSMVTSKSNVTINSPGGGVMIDTASDPGTVTAFGQPFAIASADAAGRVSAASTMANQAQLSLTTDSTGLTVASTGSEQYGLDLIVHLPSPFHGLLTVNAAFGNVTYLASPSSPGATLNVATGDIDVENAGNQLTVQGGVSNIVLVAAPTLSGPDDKGNVTAPSVVTTNVGNITAKIPDASSLTINAQTLAGGTVRPQADQVVAAQSADGMSAQIVIGDGMSGSINIGTADGEILFLRP